MKTIIFTHGDTDGLCCGALALAANGDSPLYFTNPVSVLTDIEEARGYDRVIIMDMAINRPRANEIKQKVDSLAKSADVIYIDHHPLPPGFKAPWLTHDSIACGSEITFRFFEESLDPDMSRVALYGAIGDYRDMTPGAQELIMNWDKRSLYYQAGTLSQGIEVGRRDYDFKREIVKLLARNVLPSEIPSLAKNAQIASKHEDEMRMYIQKEVVRMKNIAYVINSNGCMSKAAIYARVYGRVSVGLSAEYRDHRDVYDFSARAVGPVDLNVIVGEVTSRNGGTGGGHPMASGGRIPAKNLKDFLKDLDEAVGQALANDLKAVKPEDVKASKIS